MLSTVYFFLEKMLKRKEESRELSSIGRTIALYMQGAGVRTPVIPLIYFKDEFFSY
jgi:hypothetical protein